MIANKPNTVKSAKTGMGLAREVYPDITAIQTMQQF